MLRRNLIKSIVGAALLPLPWQAASAVSRPTAKKLRERCRPGRAGWPTDKDWENLNRDTNGRLLRPQSPFSACAGAPDSASCREALAGLKNPFYLGDQVALTQTSGWAGAWSSQPSAYAVAAETTDDIAHIKQKYDPDGLFFAHHGVGSEAWSADGFSFMPDLS